MMDDQALPTVLVEWAEGAAARAEAIFSSETPMPAGAIRESLFQVLIEAIRRGMAEPAAVVTQRDLLAFWHDMQALLSTIADTQPDTRIVITEGLAAAPKPSKDQHPDNANVDEFAFRMKAKLRQKREQGYDGWRSAPAHVLSQMLRDHVDKGDPIDVANFSMMLSERGMSITASDDRFRLVAEQAPPTGIWLHTYRDGERRSTISKLLHPACQVPGEPGNTMDAEWVTFDGRTTVTHSTFLPPTYWAPMAIPSIRRMV